QRVHPDRGKARYKRVLDHVTGQPGVFADHHPVPVIAAAKHYAGGLTDPQRQIRRDDAIGATPDSISAKILSSHLSLARFPGGKPGRSETGFPPRRYNVNLGLSGGGCVKKIGSW